MLIDVHEEWIAAERRYLLGGIDGRALSRARAALMAEAIAEVEPIPRSPPRFTKWCMWHKIRGDRAVLSVS